MTNKFAQRIQQWGRVNRAGQTVVPAIVELKTIIDGIGYIGVSEDVVEQTLESGIGPTGAFFTALPVAYADQTLAAEAAKEQYGESARILAVDTSMVPDFASWQRNGKSLDSMVVWGAVPAEAISEVRPVSQPSGPTL
ncbi:hypothetical protein [Rhizobium sp. BK176]|uniref:hypothetical protein n=1 Tax=Rhizobium sp. BK176 TaxID=2587071 RepID=UPI00216A8A6F|nr:hypothetical protein [Rhizobium sp. BK176]MCS4088782.1 hypothetical protein [Rhizobium sp. BK176]